MSLELNGDTPLARSGYWRTYWLSRLRDAAGRP